MKTVFLLLFCCWSAGHSAAHVAPGQPDSTRKNTPAAHVTGDVSLSTGFYAMRGLGADQSQVMPWGLTGNITLTTRAGWVVPVQRVWSSETNQYGQPYNQIGVSPRFRNWLTLHGGYRNVVFSPLTLAGHTFLGAGIELNPGVLRVGAVMGKFNRAIEANKIYTAVQASLSYRSKYANLKIHYKRIEPDYKSMGAYYFQHDLDPITNQWEPIIFSTIWNGSRRLPRCGCSTGGSTSAPASAGSTTTC